MNSKPIKFNEVKDKRLLKATPMEREKLIFVDNSYFYCICRWCWRKLTTKLPCSSPILLGWFESFALQNIQSFFNNEVTNVNVCTKHKLNFILREFTSFMTEQI